MTDNHYTGHERKNTTGLLNAAESPEEPNGGGEMKNDG